MRLLWVTPMPPRPEAPGAIPVLLHAELQALQRRHEVSLVTVAGPEPGEEDAVEALRAAGVPVWAVMRRAPQGWARWRRRWRFASGWLRGQWPWRTVWFWDPGLQPLLEAVIRTGSYDLIQVEDNAMGAYRYPPHIASVFIEHEVRRPRPIDWNAGSPRQWPGWALREADWQRWPAYQRRAWRKFNRLLVFTQRDADAAIHIAPDLASRVRVNPFGVLRPDLPMQTAEDAGELLFAGNFTHLPNVDAALWLGHEVMPRLWRRCAAAHLTVVGTAPPPAVAALACDRITVTGPVPEIAPYYQRAAICMAPVRIGGGMRTKVLHGMAYGKPVITTPRGAEGLAVSEAQPPVIVAVDADGLAQAAADLLADEGRRQALGRAGRDYVAEHLSAEAWVRRNEAVYEELLAVPRGARQ